MSENYKSWTKRIAQIGLVSKGVVYMIFGVLILMATYSVGDDPIGLFEIVQYIMTKGWFGLVIVLLMAIGLLCYSAWKFFQMTMNLEGYEKDFHGYFVRTTWVGPLFFYLFLAGHAFRQLYNWFFGQFHYYEGKTGKFEEVLNTQWGKWIVAFVAISLLINAITLFYLAFTGRYKIMLTGQFYEKSPRLARLTGVIGYVAYGVALFITAILFAYSIYESDQSYLDGQKSMFWYLIVQPFGQLLLSIIASGTICYGLYFLLASFYRWRNHSSSESSTSTGK